MSITLAPRVSEKAVALSEQGVYVFDVPTSTNKIEVAKAVAAQFNVKVAAVNMMIQKGKVAGRGKLRGRRKDIKKAVVTLEKGQSIKLFEGAK